MIYFVDVVGGIEVEVEVCGGGKYIGGCDWGKVVGDEVRVKIEFMDYCIV